jgi:DNA-binding transcriptional ArsR family regulator
MKWDMGSAMPLKSNFNRIQRLLDSGLCTAESPTKYVEELRRFVKREVDERRVKRQSGIFKAISNPTRLKIVEMLSARDLCVCEIMTALKLTQPTASHHLKILKGAGLLKDEKRGKWVFYSLSNPDIAKLLEKSIQ